MWNKLSSTTTEDDGVISPPAFQETSEMEKSHNEPWKPWEAYDKGKILLWTISSNWNNWQIWQVWMSMIHPTFYSKSNKT
jgi:hypothetical protein